MEDLYQCKCGVLLNLDIAKDNQHDWNAIRQKYRCPVCNQDLPEDK